MEAMDETALQLCKNIEGARLAYVQSDEISIFLTDYQNENTQPWFGNNLQKIVSVSASIATLAFNRIFKELIDEEYEYIEIESMFPSLETEIFKKIEVSHNAHQNSIKNGAMFDARAFILPKEEVCNYFISRQQDAIRNSILSLGYANFSTKELLNLKCDKIQDKLFIEKGINWNDYSTREKRGACVLKDGISPVKNPITGELIERRTWQIDCNIPIFTQDRNYIERFV